MVMRRALLALWLGLLLLPNAATVGYANAWEAAPWQLALVGLWTVATAWLLAPPRLFLLATLPIAFAGIAVVAADRLRHANLLELVSVAYTFRAGEVAQALRPYAIPAALMLLALLALLAALWRGPAGPRRRPLAAALALAGLLLAVTLPAAAWRQSWPAALLVATLDAGTGDAGLAVPDVDHARASPRDRLEQWQASRAEAPDRPETYVLVIGESVRSDRIPGCGGRAAITPVPADALLFCDMLAGSSSTHTAVPLLVSRDLPGLRERVPRDATVLKAFEAAGFETFWFAVQERSIAWPDARNQAFEPTPRMDRDALLPLLDQALARGERRKLIVLHAYNAHAPYGDRYDHGRAPFPVDRRIGNGEPRRATLDQSWNDYDNAIDETLRFLGDVIGRLRSQPGDAFLVFTPDHAENMLDDARGLTAHALRTPTLWDTQVPAVVWASATWRDARARSWQTLQANRQAALMHMDVVPTLLGAAGIRYAEPRREPVDLTQRVAGPRQRFTQVRPGVVVSLEQLRLEAAAR